MRNSFPSSLLLLPLTCCTKRTVHIRTVRFFVPCAGRAGNHLSSEKHPSPLCLLFLFFKKRNRSPILFFLERKGRKENQLRNSFPSPLLLLPPTCCTKRTVQMRTVRFSVPSRTCGKPPFLRKTPFPAVSFVSFLQEKKTSPFFKEKKSSPLLFARRAA